MADTSSERFVLLNQLADEFAERYRRGERPSLQEYVDRHPELADDIREVLPALVEMEQVKEDRHAPVEQAALLALSPLERLGDYRILREIGHGGMGVVYEAEQVSLGRHVALKVLPQQRRADEQTRRRFEREARAAAKLHHTNIVPVFGVGEHDGMPYYVMQFIGGQGLDVVLEELKRLREAGQGGVGERNAPAAEAARSLITGRFAAVNATVDSDQGVAVEQAHAGPSAPGSPSASSVVLPGSGKQQASYWQSVARVGVQVADALAHAHAQGVLHRDVKPSNLLLDTAGTVWVTDFGLAKADDQQNLTHTGDILGTLRYMPPEAFDGKSDPRGDVYSLGLTLYELLAFRPAFDERDRNRLVKQVTHEEPARLSKLNRSVPRDLETIVHTAIDREPGRRYQTAADLAADLQRFLDDEPIKARRISSLRRVVRWAHRRPAAAGLLLASGVAALALVWASVAFVYNQELYDKNVQLEGALQQAEVEKYFRHIAEASNGLRTGNMTKVERLLEQCPVGLRNWEWHYLQRQCHADLLTLHTGYTGLVNLSVAFSPDGRWLAASGSEADLTVWDLTTGLKDYRTPLPGPPFPPWGLAFSRDSRLLAWGGPNKVLPPDRHFCTVRVWEVTTRKLVQDLVNEDAPTRFGKLAFSFDGTRIAAGHYEKPATVWDLTTGQKLHTLRRENPEDVAPYAVAFSPVRQQLAMGWGNGKVEVCDLSTDKAIRTPLGKNAPIRDLAYSPDGEHLALACDDRTIRIWDVVSRKLLFSLTGHTGMVTGVAYSPDGRRLASSSEDGTVRLWDATSGRELRTYRGHTRGVGSVAFSPDGLRLASAGSDKVVKIWDATLAQEALPLNERGKVSASVVFSPDGQRLATGEGNNVKLWDAASRQVIYTLVGHNASVNCLSFSRDGQRLASGSSDNTVKVWDVETGKFIRTLPGHSKAVNCVTFDAHGTKLVSGGRDGCVKVWDLNTGRNACDDPLRLENVVFPVINAVVFSPDGKSLAVSAGGDDPKQYVTLWDTTTWERVPGVSFVGHTRVAFGAVAFSPDGKLLVTGSQDQAVRIWDVRTGKLIRTLEGHTGTVFSVSFSRDGKRLASAGYGPLRIWDTDRWDEVLVLEGQSGFVSAAFDADGHWISQYHWDGTLNLWDGRPWDDVAASRLPVEREASGLLDSLFAMPLSKKDVLDHLHNSPTIRPQSRQLAVDLVGRYREEADPERYYQASLAIARQPYLNAFQYSHALRQARTAYERARENGRYQIALGVAQYRAGEYREALTTLQKRDDGTPVVLAFLAMAQHRAGRNSDAATTLERLRQTMQKPGWAANAEAQCYLREAEAVVRGAKAPKP